MQDAESIYFEEAELVSLQRKTSDEDNEIEEVLSDDHHEEEN